MRERIIIRQIRDNYRFFYDPEDERFHSKTEKNEALRQISNIIRDEYPGFEIPGELFLFTPFFQMCKYFNHFSWCIFIFFSKIFQKFLYLIQSLDFFLVIRIFDLRYRPKSPQNLEESKSLIYEALQGKHAGVFWTSQWDEFFNQLHAKEPNAASGLGAPANDTTPTFQLAPTAANPFAWETGGKVWWYNWTVTKTDCKSRAQNQYCM